MTVKDTKGSFDALLGELEQMHKALPTDGGSADDDKIEAAADGGDDKKDEAKLDLDGDAEKAAEEETMGKSFVMKLDDGTEVEAVDGTELVKSLSARIDATEEVTVKALSHAVEMIKAQGAMIKSLGAKVEQLSGAGRGRKTVITVAEKPGPTAEILAKSDSASMTGAEFMVKAMDAFSANRITGLDVSRIESYLNRGLEVPKDIAARVLSK